MSAGPDPPDRVLADITSQANNVLGEHVDQSEKKPAAKKRPRENDAGKIESLYNSIDVLREIASLQTHAISYFKAVLTTQNKSLLNPVLSALEYAVKTQNEELKKMVSSANNTSTKKQAQQAHSKVTKKQRQESASHALQMQRLMKGNPSKTLQLSLKRAKDTIQSIRQPC